MTKLIALNAVLRKGLKLSKLADWLFGYIAVTMITVTITDISVSTVTDPQHG
jgi:hypothetical protein